MGASHLLCAEQPATDAAHCMSPAGTTADVLLSHSRRASHQPASSRIATSRAHCAGGVHHEYAVYHAVAAWNHALPPFEASRAEPPAARQLFGSAMSRTSAAVPLLPARARYRSTQLCKLSAQSRRATQQQLLSVIYGIRTGQPWQPLPQACHHLSHSHHCMPCHATPQLCKLCHSPLTDL